MRFDFDKGIWQKQIEWHSFSIEMIDKWIDIDIKGAEFEFIEEAKRAKIWKKKC